MNSETRYENKKLNHLQYNPYDEMIRESGQCYTTEETSYPQPKDTISQHIHQRRDSSYTPS